MFIIKPDLQIARLNGGFIISYESDDEHNEITIVPYDDDLNGDIELLYTVQDILGTGFTNRYKISIEKIFDCSVDVNKDFDDIVDVMKNIWYNIPVNEIDFRCTKHPNYDGKTKPNNNCKYCSIIYEINKD